jgi:hypothetical protein
MAGLVPAIHVLNAHGKKGVDARDKPGTTAERMCPYFITPFSL